ncbi:MAG: class I SAM-dependent methyltransferase [Terriglobia bacterium]
MNVVKEYIKSHVSRALLQSVRQVEKEFRIYRRHRLGVREARALPQGLPLKLNLGCGPNRKPGWLNIDLFYSGADLELDLRERWPFPDGSVAHIYSEHVFEHFEFYEQVPHVLSESLRVLQTEGVFDVGVPDSEWPLRGYGNPDCDYWSVASIWHPSTCETQLDHINYHFRQGEEHKYAWDEETLARSLQRSGFASIARRPYDATLDSESRRIGTLYMRALKPRTVPSAGQRF